MTCIAWDGENELAADRRIMFGTFNRTVNKSRFVKCGAGGRHLLTTARIAYSFGSIKLQLAGQTASFFSKRAYGDAQECAQARQASKAQTEAKRSPTRPL